MILVAPSTGNEVCPGRPFTSNQPVGTFIPLDKWRRMIPACSIRSWLRRTPHQLLIPRRGLHQAASPSPLPIIDVGSLVDTSSSPEAKAHTARELHEACQRVGFFYLRNHGVPPSVTQGALDLATKFFHLPEEAKRSISIVSINKKVRETRGQDYQGWRGYQRVGENVTGGPYDRDLHEAIDMYCEDFPTGDYQESWLSQFRGSNPFLPEEMLPGFRDMFQVTYVQHMLALGNAVMRGFALGFGLPEDYFAPYYTHSYWCMRVIRYPPLAPQEARTRGGMGCGQHCDYGCLTILNVDPSQGFLQAQTVDGDWVFADPIPDTFITNVGDMLSRWSNEKFRSTPHRVLPATAGGRERISIPFFFEPNLDAVIQPLPACEAFARAKGQQFEPIRYCDHLRGKLSNNFNFLG